MPRPGRASLRALRTLILLIFLGSTAGVLYLLFGTDKPPQATSDPESPIERPEVTPSTSLVATGFKRSIEQEGRTLFSIAGERLLADREDNVFLEGVLIEVARPDGQYRISSDEAEYNEGQGRARLEGDVVVTNPEGMKMHTDWLDLAQNGNVMETSKGSRFELGGEFEGEAQRVRIDLVEEVIVMRGGVVVRTRESAPVPTRLRADQVVFQQPNRLIRAQGNVVMRRAGDELRCERVSLYLDEAEDIVRYVRALWKVRGTFSGESVAEFAGGGSRGPTGLGPAAASGGSARFRAASLALAINRRSEIESLDLEGVRKTPAVFASDDGEGLTRRVSAAGIRVVFAAQQARRVDALGDVELVEFPVTDPEDQLRRGRSESLVAEFDDQGRLAKASLDGTVRLVEGELEADAARAEMQLVQNRIELIGEPLVAVRTREGNLDAPTVTFNQATGLVHATGGVRSQLAESTSQIARGPLGDDEPIRVQAQEALLRRGSSEFLFREEVRAWSGSNVLLADQLRGNQGGTELSASGRVRSVLVSASDADDLAPERAPGEATGNETIEIESQLLLYSQADGDLNYQGDVVARQLGREIRCQDLHVQLTDSSEAERMTCDDQTSIVDPSTRRTIRADRAEYELRSGEVVLYGEPLTLEDPTVGKVSGYRLWYSMESGLFKLGEGLGQTTTDS